MRRKRNRRQAGRAAARRRVVGVTFLVAVSLSLGVILLGGGLFWFSLTQDLPTPDAVRALYDPPDGVLLRPSRLLARDGATLLGVLEPPGAPRRYLPLYNPTSDHLPESLVQATLALADPDFYQNEAPLLAQRLVEPLFWNERAGFQRDWRLRLLAARVIRRFGHDQVLEWYLNTAPYGHLTVGAESAARYYFGKSAAELTLPEAALLAAIGEAPALTPYDSPQAVYFRQQTALQAMAALGFVDEATARQARATPVTLQPRSDAAPSPVTAAALAQLQDLLPGLRPEQGGLSLRTTLDAALQADLDCLLTRLAEPAVTCPGGLRLPFDQPLDVQAQVLVFDHLKGEVLAFTATPGANAIFHPAGSSLWPLVYLAGFTRGMTPASLVWDVPTEGLIDWDGQFHGPERLRVALANDDQAPLRQVLTRSGAGVLAQLLQGHGLPAWQPDNVLSGQQPVSPLMLAGTYATWANGGLRVGRSLGGDLRPALLADVARLDGLTLLPAAEPTGLSVVSPQLAWLMTDILSDPTVRRSPDAPLLDAGLPAAVKPAVTADGTSAWVVGYSPRHTVVVWVENSTGLDTRVAVALWQAVIRRVSQDENLQPWTPPVGISQVAVCDPSGMLPTENCPQVVRETFITGTEPIQADTLFRSYAVNRETGHLATVFTPPDLVEMRVYLDAPEEMRDFVRDWGWEVPPRTYDALLPPPRNPQAAIDAPDLFAFVRGEVPISGTAAGDGFGWYALQAGHGLYPERWQAISERQNVPVENGRLAVWDTRSLEDGLYALRLQRVATDGSIQSAVTLVTVDNTPPMVMPRFPTDGAEVEPSQSVLLRADATDNLQLDTVTFYLDGQALVTRQQPPWAALATLSPGPHTLRIVARDAAGNVTAETLTFSIRR